MFELNGLAITSNDMCYLTGKLVVYFAFFSVVIKLSAKAASGIAYGLNGYRPVALKLVIMFEGVSAFNGTQVKMSLNLIFKITILKVGC